MVEGWVVEWEPWSRLLLSAGVSGLMLRMGRLASRVDLSLAWMWWPRRPNWEADRLVGVVARAFVDRFLAGGLAWRWDRAGVGLVALVLVVLVGVFGLASARELAGQVVGVVMWERLVQ